LKALIASHCYGLSQGCAISIAYAARHPDRVTQLILYGGFARGRRKRGSREDIAKNDALETLIRQGWGQDNPAFRQMLTSLFMPDATTAKWIHSMIYSASRHPPTPRGCVARLTR
jgi:pimeloyl-ACP methyl ester carboxylesterase